MHQHLDFYLDQDMPTDVRSTLVRAGFGCWTAADASREEATDTDQAIYAQAKGAVFVTFDRELVHSRRRMPIGRIVRLECAEYVAGRLLAEALDGNFSSVRDALARKQNLFVRITRRSDATVHVRYTYGTERPR